MISKHNSVLDVAARHTSSNLYNYHHSWGSADQRLWSLFALKESSCLQVDPLYHMCFDVAIAR